ncbi:coxsackievirus and adenovirus receptor homolog [Neosynchiropus ocellatus]
MIGFSAEVRGSQALQVTSTGPQTIRMAKGESVVLGCTYKVTPFDTGKLDIEWSLVSPDTTQKDKMLISHTSGSTYDHAGGEAFTFSAADPSHGDASLSIMRLSLAHSGTYQCKVKKSPGVDMRKISLVVMAKPSVPKCWLEGTEMVGEPVALHCESAGGATPLTYSWSGQPPAAVPPAATQSSESGVLKISNHSLSFAGLYVCEVNNAVGAERCSVYLRADKPPNAAALIVGTVVGSILLSFILLVFIALLYWRLRTAHRCEKELSNEIREDAPPPESRPLSRHTSRSSVRHPSVIYCPLGEKQRGNMENRPIRSNGYTAVTSTPLPYVSSDCHAV